MFEGSDNFAYCQKDYHEVFADKCATCGQMIVGQMISAANKKYHPEHFVCFSCKEKFTGPFFPADDGTCHV